MVNFLVIDTENQTVDAGDGDNTVLVYANGAVVRGGEGDDWLAANLHAETTGENAGGGDSEPDEAITTELHGDAGDDLIHASLRMTNSYLDTWAEMSAVLTGGEGNDQLFVDVVGIDAGFSVDVDGGAGDDDIRISALGRGDLYLSGGSVEVDAGDGDDTISIDATGRSGGGDVTVHAGDGDDLVEATSSFIDVSGDAWGWNYLYGGDGDDTLIGDAATRNEAEGGDGNDRIILDASYNTASGGTGDDWVEVTSSGGDENAAGFGENVVTAGTGNDTVEATLNFFFEGYGANEIHGDEGDDLLTGVVALSDGAISDAYSYLSGGTGNDTLIVRGGSGNQLFGNQGDDTLRGGSGEDHLIGGAGADYLRGNGGADTFEFWGARGLSAGERDRIADFTIGEDLIDVSRIDAKSWRPGNQAFTFDPDGEGRSGTLWVEDNPDNWGSIVYANTGRAMLAINLLDGRGVSAEDYSASDFIL